MAQYDISEMAAQVGMTADELGAAAGVEVFQNTVFGRRNEARIIHMVDQLSEIHFTRIGDEWGIMGRGLVAGQQATVTKRDGSQKQVTVATIISDEDGVQTATIAPEPRRTTSSTYRHDYQRGYRMDGNAQIWDYS